jgi:hypothetical protein
MPSGVTTNELRLQLPPGRRVASRTNAWQPCRPAPSTGRADRNRMSRQGRDLKPRPLFAFVPFNSLIFHRCVGIAGQRSPSRAPRVSPRRGAELVGVEDRVSWKQYSLSSIYRRCTPAGRQSPLGRMRLRRIRLSVIRCPQNMNTDVESCTDCSAGGWHQLPKGNSLLGPTRHLLLM